MLIPSEDAAAPAGKAPEPRRTLTREAWLDAARKLLERRGIAAVKIDGMARQFEVTRGSFYFHFAGLQDLHDGLLDIWRQRNCVPFAALERVTMPGAEYFSAVIHVFVDEAPFSPSLDMAIRDWARSSRSIAAELEASDALRLALLTRAFRDIGYDEDESLVRARISYLHQIGYYAVAFKESAVDRKRYQPIYGHVLEGPLVK